MLYAAHPSSRFQVQGGLKDFGRRHRIPVFTFPYCQTHPWGLLIQSWTLYAAEKHGNYLLVHGFQIYGSRPPCGLQ